MNALLEARRIGIIKLTSLGDILLATPVAANLRRAKPDAFIGWIVEDRLAEVLDGNPHLDEVVPLPRLPWPPWKELRTGRGTVGALRHSLSRWRDLRLDTAIDLQGLLKSGLLGVSSGAQWRVAGSRAREGSRYLANLTVPQLPPEAGPTDGYLHFLEHFGIPVVDRNLVYSVGQSDRESASQFLKDLSPGPVVAFAAASAQPIKDWPPHRYAGLANCLKEEIGAHIALLGSGKDQPVAAAIQTGMKARALDLTGKTTIRQLAAVLERCSLLIAGDSGPLFLAAAVGTPVLGLFGPTNGSGFAPALGADNILWKPPPCSPCRDWNCGTRECMLAISVEDVLVRLHRMLGNERLPTRYMDALVGGSS